MVIWEKSVPGLTDAAFRSFLLRARRAAGLAGGVQVLVTGNSHMRALNRQFRRKDKPTDVLSFPADVSVKLAKPSLEAAGEIAISAEVAARSARLLGHSVGDEIKILALHGILHLAGYDHEHDEGQMARKEARLRHALRLPGGLIQRAQARPAKPPRSNNKRRTA